MLEPNDRRHLLNILRPPEGCRLDFAIGTTFSLDLLTLMTVPLAFALFDWEDDEGRPGADTLALLEALRRHAAHTHIFCQAGQIAVPRSSRLLLHLERSVYEVNAPVTEGVFHPKVWALRFSDSDGAVSYRVLCLSRNLTFDRAWDTALTLEGQLVDRKNSFAMNHPLGDFIATLPHLASRPLPEATLANIEIAQSELRRVRFETPPGFDEEIRFWPLGIEGHRRSPFEDRIDRLLVISPFLSASRLSALAPAGGKNVLVSRLESLDEIAPEVLTTYPACHYLNPTVETEDNTGGEAEGSEEESLRGLHAKLYVADAGWNARLWTGSANATESAFSRNVEFLIELTGKKSQVGIDALLCGGGEKLGLRDLLQEFIPGVEARPPDELQRQLEMLTAQAGRALARALYSARVLSDEGDLYAIELESSNPISLPEPGLVLRCWPVTLSPDPHALTLDCPQDTLPAAFRFERLSFEALTTFFAFEVKAARDGREHCRRFVLNISLTGAPADRAERMLRLLLQNRDQVLRFLLFLLADDASDDLRGLLERPGAPEKGASWGVGGEATLFETLVGSLERDPTRLDQVAHLVDDLRKTEEGSGLLPLGFNTIWEPIWAARQRMKS